jgi:hypothetical protein
MCIFGCFNLMGGPPMIDLGCIGNCEAQACANGQFFANQVANCAVAAFVGMKCKGGGILNCLMQQCGPEIAACIGSKCQ